MARFHDYVDDLFSSVFGGLEPFSGQSLWPAIDVSETEDSVMVKAEIPGCKADDIDISVRGNILTITGEKKREEEKREKGYYHAERIYGSFRRDMTLPSEIDQSRIAAVCKDGILSITMPKSEKAKAVKIKVKEE